MNFNIDCSPYEIQISGARNVRPGSPSRRGNLIRVDFMGAPGFADLCPLPEYGQAPVEDILNHPKHFLFQRSLQLALQDGQARRNGENLLLGREQIQSHLTYLEQEVRGELPRPDDRTSKIKIKMGAFAQALGRPDRKQFFLNEIARIEELARRDWILRLDSNGVLTLKEFEEFWETLSLRARAQIEWVEDPVPFHWTHWRSLVRKTPLAADLELQRPGVEQELRKGNDVPFQFLVLKPALMDPEKWCSWAADRRLLLCFTSLLDHPIGQAHAMAAALKAKRDGYFLTECGLATLDLVQVMDQSFWQARIEQDDSTASVKPAVGVGWSEALEKITWISNQVRGGLL
jgi:O-succinylbenzoate synthase